MVTFIIILNSLAFDCLTIYIAQLECGVYINLVFLLYFLLFGNAPKDYQHAKETYKQFVANPDQYERSKNQDPRADPVNPKWHFGPLLGW
jgi:hypothetical protein